jgi:glycosyltransferase A (GT-A) superfamily protein (DUF2064 family)
VAPAAFAAGIGAAGAASLSRALVEDAVGAIRPLPWARPLRACDDDLGRVLPQAMREHDGAAVFALAAASPGLPPTRLEAARAALGRADAVLGPTDGGGVYLVGLRRCPRDLLAGLAWSAPGAFAEALARLRGRGLAPRVLDRWFSIAGAADLDRLHGLLRAGVVAAAATARLLAPRISVIVCADGAGDDGLITCLDALDRVPGLDDVDVVAGLDGIAAAARAATGDVLWFVRAGTRVPPDADRHIVGALLDPDVVAGAFGTLRPRVAGGLRPWLAPLARLADLRSRLTGLPHAGQAMFVRRAAFERVGGVPPGLLGELELARRLRQLGRIVRVPARVLVTTQVPQPIRSSRPRTGMGSHSGRLLSSYAIS